jgi:hypothetical protein
VSTTMNATMTMRPIEIAELNYAEAPSGATAAAWEAARRDEEHALARARGKSHAEAANARRAAEKDVAAKRKRLSAIEPVADGFAASVSEIAKWFATTQMAALEKIKLGHEAIDRQIAAVREVERLKADLGITTQTAGFAHAGQLRGEVARAQGAALRKACGKDKDMIRVSVAEFFRPASE